MTGTVSGSLSPLQGLLSGPGRGLISKASSLSRSPHEPGGGPGERGRWSLSEVEGRMVEISGQGPSAALTLALDLVLDAQLLGENVAWVSVHGDVFFPPDAAATGIDLDALPVVLAGSVHQAGRAMTHLMRSGAFALVVIDLGADNALPQPLQTRLVGLTQHHGTTLLCVTDKGREAPSVSSLVSLRVQASRQRLPDGSFRCELSIIKDKRRGPGWSVVEECHGPDGLC